MEQIVAGYAAIDGQQVVELFELDLVEWFLFGACFFAEPNKDGLDECAHVLALAELKELDATNAPYVVEGGQQLFFDLTGELSFSKGKFAIESSCRNQREFEVVDAMENF